MINPSHEQQQIIDAILAGHSVIVNAVAGSGKTSMIGMLSQQTNKSIALITYNKHLQLETKSKLHDVDVFTYHGFANVIKLTGPNVKDDNDLHNLVKANNIDTDRFKCDILVIDEAQDMNMLYYKFICMYVNPKIQLVVMGDHRQAVYGYMGANYRYLTEADHYFSAFKFKRFKLETCYRCSANIVDFVNVCMLKTPYMKAIKPAGNDVYYFKGNANLIASNTCELILSLINTNKYKPSDVFILSSSVKEKSNAAIIANKLSNKGILIHKSDNDNSSDKCVKDKVYVSSHVKSKGRERKIVVLADFDANSMSLKNNPNICPNTHYVAATRACDYLIVIQKCDTPVQYANLDNLPSYVKLVSGKKYGTCGAYDIKMHKYNVTDFVKFIRHEYIIELNQIVNELFVEIAKPTTTLRFNDTIQTNKKIHEYVADINGIAMVEYYSDHKFNKDKYINSMKCRLSDHKHNMHAKNTHDHTTGCNICNHVDINKLEYGNKIDRYLYAATYDISYNSNYMYRLKQINSYDWITQDVDIGYKRIEPYIADVEREVNGLSNIIRVTHNGISYECQLSARFDAINKTNLYEFKCVNELTLEHKLQLIVYAYIKPGLKYKLINFKTGQIYEMKPQTHLIDHAVELLLLNKQSQIEHIDDY
jgi:hypothetical protein